MFLRIAAYRKTEKSPLVCMSQGSYEEIIEATIEFTSSIIQQILKEVPEEKRKEVKEKLYNKYIETLKKSIEVRTYKMIKKENKKKEEGED